MKTRYPFIGPMPCGGVVSHDMTGKILHRYACEVHLFLPGVCAWQRKVHE